MRSRICAVIAVAVVSACGGEATNPLEPLAAKPTPAIVDGRNGGRDGFYFLAPIVDNPGVVGPFDGTIAPRARVCALAPTRTSCATTLATLLTGTGQGALAADPTTGAFAGNWPSPSSLAISTTSGPETRYRLEIELDVGATTVVLGYADIWVVAKQKDLKTAPAGFIGLLLGKSLQIRFGVLPATVSYVTVTPNPASLSIGATQQMTAVAYDTHDAVVAGAVFTWSSDDNAVATVSSSGLATGVTNGSTNIKATTSGVTGSAVINVTGTPPAPPDAVDDGPAGGSVPGDPFHTALDEVLKIWPNLLANDDRGSPLASVSSFGGGTLGGTVTSNVAGTTATFGTGGSLTVNDDGSFFFSPSIGFTGVFNFSYRLTNGSGSDDAVVTIKVGAPPSASNDTYPTTIIGNVSINTASGSRFSVLSNDAGSGLTINLASSPNGNTAINADGTFTFNPAPGFTGTATFTYTVQNGFGTSAAATVSIPVTTPIWFVDDNAAAGGDGRLSAPFNCLVDAGSACYDNSANEAGDVLFIASGSYANSNDLALKNTQTVIGQGASSSIATITGLTKPADSPALPLTGGTAPSMTSATNGVFLASSNRLYGLDIGNTGGIGLYGFDFGALTVAGVSLPGASRTGQALYLYAGTFTSGSTFGTIVSTSGTVGITMLYVGGSFSVTGATTVSGSTQYGIGIYNSTAGSFSFGNTTVTSTGGTGVLLSSNAANISFDDLDIAPNAGQDGLYASGNTGTIATTSGTIATSGNHAINITGPAGRTPLSVALTSVSATEGSGGIAIANTSGAFSISGSGTSSSGGIIQNMSGNGISLTNVSQVVLSLMTVQNNAASGINGAAIDGFTLHAATVQQNGDAHGESGVGISGLTGSAAFTNNTIRNSYYRNISIENSSGTLSITFSGNTVSNVASATNVARGIVLTGQGSAAIAATIANNSFIANPYDHVAVHSFSTAGVSAAISGNTFSCGNPIALFCNVSIISAGNGPFTYVVENNLITGAKAVAFDLLKNGGTGNMFGTIATNVVGTTGVVASGVTGNGIKIVAQGNGGAHIVSVLSNRIYRYGTQGIRLQATETATLDATVTGNLVAEPEGADSYGVFATVGTGSTAFITSCASITANSITGASTGSGRDFFLIMFGLTSLRLPGYSGGTSDNASVVAFVRANQTGATATTPTGTANNNVAGGGGGFIGGAACATPP